MNDATDDSLDTRRRGFLILGIVVLAGALSYLAYWLLVLRHFEATDDAYVATDVVQITSEVPGTVLAVNADDTQSVSRGAALVELDPADAQIGVDAAEADLARTVRNVRALYAQAAQLRALIVQREAELKRSEEDYARRQALAADGAVSGEEIAHSREITAQQRAALEAARQQLVATLVQTENTTIETHPEVMASSARLRDAVLALRRVNIQSPIDGVVAKRAVQIGQHVSAGAPLMAVVALDDVWVDANFKENQLRHVRVGQPVKLHADLYGKDVTYAGTVAGVSAGSGSAFALLPAQNASGNWIKVVQRLPVRISLDPAQVREHPLRVGLSMRVEVDTRDRSGALVATSLRAMPQPAQRSDGDDPETDVRIAQIIRQNSGTQLAVRNGTAGSAVAAKQAGP